MYISSNIRFLNMILAGTGTAHDVNLLLLSIILTSSLILGVLSLFDWFRNFVYNLISAFDSDFERELSENGNGI